MVSSATPSPPTMRSDGAKKKELIYETAMTLFRQRGFEATTMRAIAKEANISLGSAYHYYASKIAIVFEFYQRSQERHEETAAALFAGDASHDAASQDVAERLTALMLAKVDYMRGDRQLLGHIAATAVTPGDTLSAFAPETRDLRERSIALFDRALGELDLGPHRRAITVLLWVAHLGVMLYLIHDPSPDQANTDALVRDAARQLTPLLMLANTPFAQPLIAGLSDSMSRAGLLPADHDITAKP